jgi:coatomer protein complex subunit alpha (xenin)
MTIGSMSRLSKMQQISANIGDNMGRFHNAVLTGDVKERIKVLAEIGQSKVIL